MGSRAREKPARLVEKLVRIRQALDHSDEKFKLAAKGEYQ